MTLNHLPGGKELTQISQSLFSEAVFEGLGFGLGFAMTVDLARRRTSARSANTSGAGWRRPPSGWILRKT
jgi:hypothetical protein